MYRCVNWTVKKAESQIIHTFELWCWRRLLRVPFDSKEIHTVNPKWNQSWIFIRRTDAEAEAPILWPTSKSWLTGKDPDAGKDWGQEDKGVTEDEVDGWCHQFSGHEFEQTLGDSNGHGSLLCYSPWGRRVRQDWITEQQNGGIVWEYWCNKYYLYYDDSMSLWIWKDVFIFYVKRTTKNDVCIDIYSFKNKYISNYMFMNDCDSDKLYTDWNVNREVSQFSCWVLSDCLRPHELQHATLPCPLPTRRACPNSCTLNWWCHPTISSSVVTER